jgi:hypothetical protein
VGEADEKALPSTLMKKFLAAYVADGEFCAKFRYYL